MRITLSHKPNLIYHTFKQVFALLFMRHGRSALGSEEEKKLLAISVTGSVTVHQVHVETCPLRHLFDPLQ